MDFLQNYLPLLPRLLPPTIASPLLTLATTLFGIFKAAQTQLSPLLTRLATQPDVASVLALVAILFISLKILDMAYRAVMFWVKLVVRLVLWGTLAAVAFWVWSRGVEGFVEDAQELAGYWWGEYERFRGEAKGWKEFEEQRVRVEARQRGRSEGRGQRGWR